MPQLAVMNLSQNCYQTTPAVSRVRCFAIDDPEFLKRLQMMSVATS